MNGYSGATAVARYATVYGSSRTDGSATTDLRSGSSYASYENGSHEVSRHSSSLTFEGGHTVSSESDRTSVYADAARYRYPNGSHGMG